MVCLTLAVGGIVDVADNEGIPIKSLLVIDFMRPRFTNSKEGTHLQGRSVVCFGGLVAAGDVCVRARDGSSEFWELVRYND